MGTVSANLVAAIEPTELGNQEKVELSLAQGDFAETLEQFSDPAGCVTTCYGVLHGLLFLTAPLGGLA